MSKPTVEQLAKIQKFARKQLTEEDVYVFRNRMIDDGVTCYSSTIHPNLLAKFEQDARKGTPLMLGHNTSHLPVGRCFDSVTQYESEGDDRFLSLYGDFYVDLGRTTTYGVSTDDIAKALDTGVVADTSIGFSAKTWNCSICGNDIRDYFSCPHVPGRKYAVEENGVDTVATCLVVVGEDGDGELLENSLVYAGACNRAEVVGNFSNSGQQAEKVAKLYEVDSLKNVPLTATIFQYYTASGSAFYTDTPERTQGLELALKGSEDNMPKDMAEFVAEESQVDAPVAEETAPVEGGELNAEEAVAEEAVAEEAVVEEVPAEAVAGEAPATEGGELAVEGIVAELDLTGDLQAKDAKIMELTVANDKLAKQVEELQAQVGLAKEYRAELENKALECGVRAYGNAFNKALYSKFLATLSIDEIKDTINSFNGTVEEKFAGARTSEPSEKLAVGEETKEDFESESEFRAFVADKAVEYAKESGVSITEATKLMYHKYSKEVE